MPALKPALNHQKLAIRSVRCCTNDSFFDHALEICLILGQQRRNIRLAVLILSLHPTNEPWQIQKQ